jgi:LCCL domain
MSAVHPTSRLVVSLFAVLALTLPLACRADPVERPGEEKPIKDRAEKPAAEAGVFEVHLNDNGNLKVKLRDEKIELTTPYGKLSIPASEIHQIEFATRVPEEVTKKVEAAIVGLASADFKTRETATTDLHAAGAAALAALIKATDSTDAEVKKRAEELLTRLREEIPEDRLEVRPYDVITTPHSKIAGRISAPALKVMTTQFGELTVKLSDVRSLNVPGAAADSTALADVEPAPDSLMTLQANVGKTYRFRVTGDVNNSIWGTDVYTTDSALSTVAVHAGVLKAGQTGVVKVTILAPPPSFAGSTKNGVVSSPYGLFSGAYKVGK